MTEIYLVRHGETFAKTKENPLGVPFVCGSGSEISRSTTLTEEGKEGMRKVGEQYKDTKFDAVCVISDLIRSEQSAVEFLKGAGQTDFELVIDPRVSEIHYGDDDGMPEDKIKAKKDEFFKDREKTGRTGEDYDKARGGETFAQAGVRMREALIDIASKYPGKKVLIVSHSGSIRALMGNVVPGQDLKFGEVVKFKVEGENIQQVL